RPAPSCDSTSTTAAAPFASHQARAQRGSGPFRPEPDFSLNLLRHLRSNGGGSALPAVGANAGRVADGERCRIRHEQSFRNAIGTSWPDGHLMVLESKPCNGPSIMTERWLNNISIMSSCEATRVRS